ncbi:hypothetical protein BGX38DRAFT_1250869 [Terfezia claveryi]|nr:hypothetical protein BGX38DRAFT_1250869 [Terfezia claveryi]
MATHQLAIAKASLTASLLRADPVSVPRDEMTNFHALLDKTLNQCSSANIQTCKRWIIKYMPSKQRATSLGKYLLALAQSFNAAGCTTKPTPSPDTPKKTSGRKKALAVLYLGDSELLGDMVASCLYPGAVKQLRRMNYVLDQWQEKQYYSLSFLETLRARANDTSSNIADPLSQATEQKPVGDVARPASKEESEQPLLLPAFHGDPSLPFYDLPAANMLPHIIPNSTAPINPRLVRPIQFPNSTPSEGLSNAVKEFLKSAEAMFSGESIGDVDSDSVGGVWGKDGEGYYGWSRTFCEKMLEKRKGNGEERDEDQSSRDRGRRGYSSNGSSMSRSRSRSSRDRRRRRRSSSYSTSRSRSRSGSRARSRQRGGKWRKSYDSSSRSRSRRGSRSRSKSRSHSKSRSQSVSRSRSRSASTGQPSFKQEINYAPPASGYQQPPQAPPPNMQQPMLGYPVPYQQQQQQQQQYLASYTQFPPYNGPAMHSPPVPGTIPPSPNQIMQQLMQFGYGFVPPPPPQPPNGPGALASTGLFRVAIWRNGFPTTSTHSAAATSISTQSAPTFASTSSAAAPAADTGPKRES